MSKKQAEKDRVTVKTTGLVVQNELGKREGVEVWRRE